MKYRKMSLEGNQAGSWDEFEADPDAASTKNLLRQPGLLVERRHGDRWLADSIHAIPAWERASRVQIARLESDRGQLTAKPGLHVQRDETALTTARTNLEAAQQVVKDAERTLTSSTRLLKDAQKKADAVRHQIAAVKDEVRLRHSREPVSV